MNIKKIIDNYTSYPGGWLVGDFSPALVKTEALEVGIKEISAGTIGDGHYHKKGDEYTIILRGEAIDKGISYKEGDIILLCKNEKNFTNFIKDSLILSIKTISDTGDKYY